MGRLQARRLKPRRSRTAASAISLDRGPAIKFLRAANRAPFRRTLAAKPSLAGTSSRELAKAIEDGRLKPVVVGPIEIGVPGQAAPSGQTQNPMGDVFGQILRDLLGGKSGQLKPASLADGMGSAVFGDRLDAGRDIEQAHLESLQKVFDRYGGAQR